MSSYVYIRSEPGLWTVGFYRPDGGWEPESDHDNTQDAADRVVLLNGGSPRGGSDEGYTGPPPEPQPHLQPGIRVVATEGANTGRTGIVTGEPQHSAAGATVAVAWDAWLEKPPSVHSYVAASLRPVEVQR